MDTARRAADEAGRDPGKLKCIVRAPSHISDDLADAREQSRWFPAMVSNHVMDLIERYGEDSEIPKDLTEFVKARKFYDYKDHSRVGAAHGAFVTDEIVDRFCVLGTRRTRPRSSKSSNRSASTSSTSISDPRAGGDVEDLRRRHHPAVHERNR